MIAEGLLGHLTIGDCVETYQNLSFVRVFGDDRFGEDVLTLDKAFGEKGFTVSDPGDQFSVEVENGLDRMVFIATGMILEGPTQNRTSHYAVIVPAHSQAISVPVNCSEHGQPITKGAKFKTTTTIIAASARSGEVEQGRTWSTISRLSGSMGTSNRTGDYVSAAKEADLGEYVAALEEPHPGQVGYIAAIQNGSVSFYADVFGNQRLYASLYKMLHQSIAATAKHVAEVSKESDKEHQPVIKRGTFVSFLETARRAELTREDLDARLPGEVHLMAEPIEGSLLSHGGTVVQASLRKDVYQDELRRNGMQTMRFRPDGR